MKSDSQLDADVVEELKSDPSVDSSKIAIGVDDGVVTLTGKVQSYWQKMEAERAAMRVKGVRAVANNLAIGKHASARGSVDLNYQKGRS